MQLLLAMLISTTVTMSVMPRSEIQVTPVVAANPDGPAIAILRGDPATGPSEMLLRMPRGEGVPHVHSADYSLVVIEGRMTHTAPGDEAPEALGPGSYWFQPGDEVHVDTCLDELCLMYIVWHGPRDARRAPAE